VATVRKQTSKTGKVSYQVDFRDPQGKRLKRSFPTKTDAKTFLCKVLAAKGGLQPWASS
jgi:hypothetical protein